MNFKDLKLAEKIELLNSIDDELDDIKNDINRGKIEFNNTKNNAIEGINIAKCVIWGKKKDLNDLIYKEEF